MRIDSSFSGLLAARSRIDVAAKTVAGSNTAGDRDPGAEAATDLNRGGVLHASGAASPNEPSGTSALALTLELSELAAAKQTYTANAKLARAAVEADGQLIDRTV